MLARRHLSTAVDQPAFLPTGATNIGKVRSAQSGKLTGSVGELDGIEAVAVVSGQEPVKTKNSAVFYLTIAHWTLLFRSGSPDNRPETTLGQRGSESISLHRSIPLARRPRLRVSDVEAFRAARALQRLTL